MRCSRRAFVRVVGGTMGLAAGGVGVFGPVHPARAARRAARSGQDRYFDWRTLGETAPLNAVHVAFGEGGNSLVCVGDEGSLLIDCKTPAFGRVLRREAEALGRPLRIVVNTHHHADHTGGNHAMRDGEPARAGEGGGQDRAEQEGEGGVRIVGHVKCQERAAAGTQIPRFRQQVEQAVRELAKSEKPGAEAIFEEAEALVAGLETMDLERFAPTETISENRELEVCGKTRVTLFHFGAGHTDNDLVVLLPAQNTVHTGDLLFHNLHPFIDRPGGATTTGWIESVKKIIELCDPHTIVVPGHGELTDVEGLKAQIVYFERMREAVETAVKEGKILAEVQAIEVEEYKEYGLPQLRPMALAAIYEEVTEARGEKPE